MVEVIHTALWVSDMDRAIDYYTEGMGLRKDREFTVRGDERNVFLVGDDDGAELQLKHSGDHEMEASRAGFDHFAIGVEDTDAMAERLAAHGGEVTRGPLDSEAAGRRIAFVADPDGHLVELYGPQE